MTKAVARGSTRPGWSPVEPSGVVTATSTTAATTTASAAEHQLSTAERADQTVLAVAGA